MEANFSRFNELVIEAMQKLMAESGWNPVSEALWQAFMDDAECFAKKKSTLWRHYTEEDDGNQEYRIEAILWMHDDYVVDVAHRSLSSLMCDGNSAAGIREEIAEVERSLAIAKARLAELTTP